MILISDLVISDFRCSPRKTCAEASNLDSRDFRCRCMRFLFVSNPSVVRIYTYQAFSSAWLHAAIYSYVQTSNEGSSNRYAHKHASNMDQSAPTHVKPRLLRLAPCAGPPQIEMRTHINAEGKLHIRPVQIMLS